MIDSDILLYNSLVGLHLLNQSSTETVLEDLIGLQAQFTNYPKVSLMLRANDLDDAKWNALVKIWSHRGTMHLVSKREVGLHVSAFGYLGDYEDDYHGIAKDDLHHWADYIEDQIRHGNDTRDGLKAACQAAGMDEKTMEGVFYGWGGLIKQMAMRGRIACKTSGAKAYVALDDVQYYDKTQAQKIMLERYFTHYGPATRKDCLHFFSNWNRKEARQLLDDYLPTILKTTIDCKDYYHTLPLVEDGTIPDVVLIPGFDQFILGYEDRSRFLDQKYAREVTNVAGIISPVILIRKRVRARWMLDGERVIVTPFETLYKKDEAAVKRAVKKAFGRQIEEFIFDSPCC